MASSYEAGVVAENSNVKKNAPHNNFVRIPFSKQRINLPFHVPHFIVSFGISMLVGFVVWQGALWFFSWWYQEEQLIGKIRFKLNPFRLLQNKQSTSDKKN